MKDHNWYISYNIFLSTISSSLMNFLKKSMDEVGQRDSVRTLNFEFEI